MTPYDPHSWTSHLFDIRGSMVREILGRVSLCLGWTVAITVVHQWPLLPVAYLEIPETGHSLIGVALGLLLVFRTNASYDRFWEGRKLWGGIVNETRNLVRQTTVLLRENPERVRQIVAWTMAFPYACRGRLRGLPELGPPAERLPAGEVAEVLATGHVPLAVGKRITTLLDDARRDGDIGEYGQLQIDQNVQLLIDYIGGCERIHATPLPYAYTVHLRRALIVYCFTLPFALVGKFGWDTILCVLLITYVLFGIEEIGVEIEDPFGTDENDLPLDTICQNIERTLSEHVPPV